MGHHLIRDVQVHFQRKETGVWSGGEAREPKIVCNSPDASLGTIRGLVDDCICILRESRNESLLGRWT